MKMTETELQDAVLELASVLGWHSLHIRPARTTSGWRTAVSGDGKGWPDCVLVKDRVLYRELKVGKGSLTPDQRAWGEWLKLAGCDFGVWRDIDWLDGTIERELRT
jgi:hypothetical protein